MAVWALGLNHTTAPLDLRGRFAFAADQLPPTLNQLRGKLASNASREPEAAILSTCNRTELYGVGSPEKARAFLLSRGVAPRHLYVKEGVEALRHLYRVAAGLDSLVVGEAQILGQVREALFLARRQGATESLLEKAFQSAIALGKRARSETGIGMGAVSVAYAALDLALAVYGDLSGLSVAVLGAGEMAELFLTHLKAHGVGRILVVNRTEEKAQALAERLGGEYKVTFSDDRPPVAIFVSKQDHCLLDLLWRTRTGELPMQVPLVIANHADLEPIAAQFGASFAYMPVSAANREEAEARQLELLAEHQIELVILAKYMQVLTPQFLASFDPPDAFHRVINIHHSFLPAFQGAQPYHRAWERGVKLIGATGHYVTEELDAGPIIAQSTVSVSHRDEVEDLIRKGRDTERLALARAVRLHLKRQVMVYRGRTAVFE